MMVGSRRPASLTPWPGHSEPAPGTSLMLYDRFAPLLFATLLAVRQAGAVPSKLRIGRGRGAGVGVSTRSASLLHAPLNLRAMQLSKTILMQLSKTILVA